MEEKTKNHSWIWWLLGLIIACSVTGIMVYNNEPEIDKLFHQTDEMTEESYVVNEDTAYIAPTIQEVLEFRKHLQECKRVDSIFLTMPDVCLIDILANYGTSLSNHEIVYIYEANPETYNAVQSGARAQKLKQQFEPDSIPKKPEPEK